MKSNDDAIQPMIMPVASQRPIVRSSIQSLLEVTDIG
jgi:hypothetical protein